MDEPTPYDTHDNPYRSCRFCGQTEHVIYHAGWRCRSRVACEARQNAEAAAMSRQPRTEAA